MTSGPLNRTETKPAFKWGVIKRLFPYLWEHKGMLFLALILVLASSFLSLFGPKLSGNAIDLIDEGGKALKAGSGTMNYKAIFFYCGLMILFYILSALFSYFLSVVMIKLSKKIAFRILYRHRLFQF